MAYNPQIHDRRSIRLKGSDYSQEGDYFITICTHNKKHRFGSITNGRMCINEFGSIAVNEWITLGERFDNVEPGVFVVMPNHIHGVLHILEPARAGQPQGIAPTIDDIIYPARAGQPQGIAPTIDYIIYPARAGQPQGIAPTVGDIIYPARVGQPQGIAPTVGDIIYPARVGQPQGIAPTVGDIIYPARVGQPQGIAPTVGDIVGAYKSQVTTQCLDIYNALNETMGKLWQRNYYEHIIRNEASYHSIAEYIMNNPASWEDDRYY